MLIVIIFVLWKEKRWFRKLLIPSDAPSTPLAFAILLNGQTIRLSRRIQDLEDAANGKSTIELNIIVFFFWAGNRKYMKKDMKDC